MKLKIFIWTESNPDYSGGLAFAIAESESEAIELIIRGKYGMYVGDWDLEVKEISKCAYSIEGGS